MIDDKFLKENNQIQKNNLIINKKEIDNVIKNLTINVNNGEQIYNNSLQNITVLPD